MCMHPYTDKRHMDRRHMDQRHTHSGGPFDPSSCLCRSSRSVRTRQPAYFCFCFNSANCSAAVVPSLPADTSDWSSGIRSFNFMITFAFRAVSPIASATSSIVFKVQLLSFDFRSPPLLTPQYSFRNFAIRKDFTFSEKMEWARRLERIERAKAEERMKNPPQNFAEGKGETNEIVAKQTGFGNPRENFPEGEKDGLETS